MSQPVPSLSNTTSGIKISWNKINGVEKHWVFRKNADGKWEKFTDTTSISYTDKVGEDGKIYTYTIRVIHPSKEEYKTVYDETGVTVTYKGAVK